MTRQKQVSASKGKMGKLRRAEKEMELLHEEIFKLRDESQNSHKDFVQKIRKKYYRIEEHTPEAFASEFRLEQMMQEKTKMLVRLSRDSVLTMNDVCGLHGSDETILSQLDPVIEKAQEIQNALNKTIRTIIRQLGDLSSFFQTCTFNQPVHPLIPILMQATVFLDDQHRGLLNEIKYHAEKLGIQLQTLKNNSLQ
jgi:chromosome segregation ATPase